MYLKTKKNLLNSGIMQPQGCTDCGNACSDGCGSACFYGCRSFCQASCYSTCAIGTGPVDPV